MEKYIWFSELAPLTLLFWRLKFKINFIFAS